ncbi:hypothetical protein PFICI_13403 [Pestalotiopsis fici W106-1]|uniref:Uncharacterized protein n=1 Tax=Pestalotiopsis fici (strain W106-1 / CGMCC3.15140) TaxID=1229662 RepID=W3WMC9_PESFW|nr:uncharacterized protein PFICI_13403 [Pestalotiopsis fici W106-1]ETS74919.1 hypothetical protein PFICI_13403 [Pestalotiopsis fici W106-1]
MVSCFGTAVIGLLIGIYAGIVPAVQYYIADDNHIAILGNVGMYLGMALPTFFCWPLPLLHGRRQYILFGLTLAMPLLFPQAITVSMHRSSQTSVWNWALLLPRGLMGVSLGFANMNFQATLTDLFGASLMCSNPHQELADHDDVRRHGGGLGVWLGIWTWCFIGSLGVGFLVGAAVIDRASPAWGFYVSIILVAVALLLAVLIPEVRRSAWRRSLAEVRTGNRISRRVARGEVMMHRVKDGPKWWGQEVWHGVLLCLEMLRQPGFAIMALYCAWIYAQVILMIVLLGSLTSRYYRFRSTFVGTAVSSISIGALAAVPFQKANLFSRARYQPSKSNASTIDRKVTWTSHLVRRAIFTITLPFAGVMYTVLSFGPPVHVAFPCLFTAMVGFLSCLAIAECNGILMETWDCSDLQPGTTGHYRNKKDSGKRINYSSFPRVQAGFAVIHSLGFILAAVATVVGGMAQRNLGQRTATAVVASILLALTFLLLCVLTRFKQVEIIPRSKTLEMDRWIAERNETFRRRATVIADAKAAGRRDLSSIPEFDIEKHRRVNILELGALTRWTEIRKANRLVDQGAHSHLNRRALEIAREELGHRSQEVLDDIYRGSVMMTDLVRKASKRSMRSKNSEASSVEWEASGLPPREACTPTGHVRNHSSRPGTPFVERDCFVGQAVLEEENQSSADGGTGSENRIPVRHRSPMYAMTDASNDGFQNQNLTGVDHRPGDHGNGTTVIHRSHISPILITRPNDERQDHHDT